MKPGQKLFEKLRKLAESEKQEDREIHVQTVVQAPVDKVWRYWTDPKHITQWNYANPEWHSPAAENDLRKGGKFSYRMEAKDGSTGFDFEGVYDKVEKYRQIAYTIEDGRKVNIEFSEDENGTVVNESFEAESTYSLEMQKTGWQAILDTFKNYVERN